MIDYHYKSGSRIHVERIAVGRPSDNAVAPIGQVILADIAGVVATEIGRAEEVTLGTQRNRNAGIRFPINEGIGIEEAR